MSDQTLWHCTLKRGGWASGWGTGTGKGARGSFLGLGLVFGFRDGRSM